MQNWPFLFEDEKLQMNLFKVLRRGFVALVLSVLMSFEKKERERVLRERFKRLESKSRVVS